MTVAVKDVIDIAGHPTMAGSRAFDGAASATRHADVVDALLAAGCRIVGKANMHELAFGVTGVNDWTGTPLNPAYPEFVPGGSSSGSATAVAAGLADFALGDRYRRLHPRACRLLRRGRVEADIWPPQPPRASQPAESSLDCVGPLARDVVTIIRAMALLEPGFSCPAPSHVPRLGWVRTAADTGTVAAIRVLLDSTGCDLVEIDLPGLDDAFRAGMTIMNAEMSVAFGSLLPTGRLGADVGERLRRAAAIPASAVQDAERVRTAFTAVVDDALAWVDVLALPTLLNGAVPLDRSRDAPAALAMTRLVRPFNLSGHPAIAVPLPGTEPMSLQLVAARQADEALCATACWIEQRLPFAIPQHASRV